MDDQTRIRSRHSQALVEAFEADKRVLVQEYNRQYDAVDDLYKWLADRPEHSDPCSCALLMRQYDMATENLLRARREDFYWLAAAYGLFEARF